LREKLNSIDGAEAMQRLHADFAERYEALGDWPQALHHAVHGQRLVDRDPSIDRAR
jgi:hypothetical protein